jgi:hypothetical protein
MHGSMKGNCEVRSDHDSFTFIMGRSVPDLAIVAECSLMSLLRWSYKTGMDKSTSASNGQIALVMFFFFLLAFLTYVKGLVG